MKFSKSLLTRSLAGLSIAAASLGANATSNCVVHNIALTQLFSATFDGLVFGKSVTEDGSFFGDVPDIANPIWGVNRSVNVITTPGGDEGTGVLTYDGTSIDNLAITLPDLTLNIIDGPGPSVTTVTTNGASLHLETDGIHLLDGGLDPNFDRGPAYTAAATGLPDLLDFSSFNAVGNPGVVDTCGGGGATTCAGLTGLNLDAWRWTLQGSPSAAGVCDGSYILRAQSDNASYYEISFDVLPAGVGKAVPVPTLFAYLGLAGLLLIGVRLKQRKQA